MSAAGYRATGDGSATPARTRTSRTAAGPSRRHQDDRRRSAATLAPEDDWFFEEGVPSFDAEAETPAPRASSATAGKTPMSPPYARRTASGGRARRGKVLLAAAAGATVVLLVGGALAARALTGSDDRGETLASTPSTNAPTSSTPTTTPTSTTPAATTPTNPSSTTLPEGVSLRRGDTGENVVAVQTALAELGYSTGAADGKFGPNTEQAVKSFQSSSGLKADGVVGPATLAALTTALNAR